MAQIQTKFIADLAVTNAKIANSTIDLTTKVTGVLPLSHGGTNANLTASNGAVAYSTASAIAFSAVGTSGQFLQSNGAAAPTWVTPAFISSTLTNAHILVGNGSNVATDVAVSGDLTLANTGAFTIANLAVTNAKIANATIDLTTKVTGVLPVLNGGTGQSSYTNGQLLIGNTTGNTLVKSTLTAGTGISISNGAGSITISATGTSPTAFEEQITLSSTDITNQFVDLSHTALGSSASINSVQLSVVGGPIQQKTVDYAVSLTGGGGGVTEISFLGDLATGGNAALIAGDVLMIYYSY